MQNPDVAISPYAVRRDRYLISTDPALFQLERILAQLQASYWGGRTTAASLARCVRHSLCFALFDGPDQIGFARAVTDYATFAWLSDVYVEDSHRGAGLGSWLIETILAHPDLQGLRRIALRTKDAQPLYARYGFVEVDDPNRWMTRG